ncbi:MAG: hypothetical protein U0103_29315 [Candidatus Obscuribacterales bacterium]
MNNHQQLAECVLSLRIGSGFWMAVSYGAGLDTNGQFIFTGHWVDALKNG